MAAVSISTVPRDVTELQKLKRGQLIRLAMQLHLLDDDARDSAFKGLTPDQQAVEVYNALVQHDQMNGGAANMAPQQTSAPMSLPQQMPQPMPQQQYQPPQQLSAPVPPGPPVQPPQPPQQQYQPPMQMPPPQMQQQQYQPPPQMPPPQAPQPPQQQQMAPQQYQPPMQQQQQMPPQQTWGQPLQPPTPPAAPPSAIRQPQTASDPGNIGAGQAGPVEQLVPILKQVLEGQKVLGLGMDTLSRHASGSVHLQRIILQILLVLAEQQGMDASDVARLVAAQGDSAVDKFIAQLGGGGKS